MGLGGQLLYAGELDEESRAIVLAGNIAGCATLAATADLAMQKQAIRDGVVDFLVTSLDEALRILKNELRKRAAVAVCVGMSATQVEREMLERGVRPDLAKDSCVSANTAWTDPSLEVHRERVRAQATVAWFVESSPVKWLPTLDAIALECLDPADAWNRRWLRLSPRYLGRLAPNMRLVKASQEFVASFVEAMRRQYAQGEIPVETTILVSSIAGCEEHHFPAVVSH